MPTDNKENVPSVLDDCWMQGSPNDTLLCLWLFHWVFFLFLYLEQHVEPTQSNPILPCIQACVQTQVGTGQLKTQDNQNLVAWFFFCWAVTRLWCVWGSNLPGYDLVVPKGASYYGYHPRRLMISTIWFVESKSLFFRPSHYRPKAKVQHPSKCLNGSTLWAIWDQEFVHNIIPLNCLRPKTGQLQFGQLAWTKIIYFQFFLLNKWTAYFTIFPGTPRMSSSNSIWACGEVLFKKGFRFIFHVFSKELLHTSMWPKLPKGWRPWC
jgi:hypothetical protein